MISRRHFLQASLSAALVPLLPRVALAGTTVQVRPEWHTFCVSPLFPVLVQAIATMKANKNSADPSSWLYWSAVHQQSCPHGLPYFLAWHRGFLRRFEIQLRKVVGDTTLTLPYWDYYADPSIPSEFLDDTSPLWRGKRTGDNVANALSFDPFADNIIVFPEGKPDAYEPLLEAAPHNPVHNLIGGIMTTMSSPLDPLFWVHHANIDRLWVAWVNAGGGRRMPASTNVYWQGDFQYGAGVPTLPRIKTINTTGLGYVYDNMMMPAPPPVDPVDPPATTAAFALRSASTPTQTVAAGQGQALALDEHSTSVQVLLDANRRAQVRSLLLQPAGSTGSDPVRVVLDDVRLTALGRKGGYFYKVYLSLPVQPGVPPSQSSQLLGMLGPFEIEAARMRMQMGGGSMAGMKMHPAMPSPLQMVFPATKALRRIWPDNLDRLTVTFVRVDGSRRPRPGTVITVKQFRLETAATTAP